MGCFTSMNPRHPSVKPWHAQQIPEGSQICSLGFSSSPGSQPTSLCTSCCKNHGETKCRQHQPFSKSFIHSSSDHRISTMLGLNANKPKEQCPTKGQIHVCSSFPKGGNPALTKTGGISLLFLLSLSQPVLLSLYLCRAQETFVFGTLKPCSQEQGLSPPLTTRLPPQKEESKPRNDPCLKSKQNKRSLTKANTFL